MNNRYNRDQDDDHFGRRQEREAQAGPRRDDDERRVAERSDFRPGRFGEATPRQREHELRAAQEYRGSSFGDRVGPNRDNPGSYRSGYGLHRDDEDGYAAYGSSRERQQGGADSYPWSGSPWSNSRDRSYGGESPYRGERSPGYQGQYHEQAWPRDPNSGGNYGREPATRLPLGSFDRDRSDRSRPEANDLSRGQWRGSSSAEPNRGAGHYGKGPKGYVRSDERIREDVCDRLSDDDEVDASEISVTVTSGEVILEGTVSDRHSKHRAEDLAEAVSGVRDVINHLRARKNLFQELGDKLTGDAETEHHGHTGSGTRNSPSGSAPRSNVANH